MIEHGNNKIDNNNQSAAIAGAITPAITAAITTAT